MKNLYLPIVSTMLIFLIACTPRTGDSLAESSTSVVNKRVTSFEGEPMMLGAVNRSGFQEAPFKGWFEPGYAEYKPRESALEGVSNALKNVRITVFMGTWCSDSQLEVPQFYRILDYLKFPEKNLQVYAVDNHPDRNKTTPGGETATYKIEYVPTFIFFRDGKEIGRITEYPQKSLEADMAAIVK
jgi:thiol-disulfide isomerase/thioredoxin